MKQKKVVRAIALVLGGSAMMVGGIEIASAHVMYNTYTGVATDGWTLSEGKNQSGDPVPWLGTPSGSLPFGFQSGGQALNWAAMIHQKGDVLSVSAADAAAEYDGAIVDIDTANGAWGSWQVDPATPTFTRGWAHNTDYGLIKTMVDTPVKIEVSKVNQTDNINNFGITIFAGMDDQSGDGYSHHSAWNEGYISGVNEAPAKVDNPHGTGGLAYLVHGDQSSVMFNAVAGQVYSVYLGGNDVNGDIFGTPYGYKVTISAVPVPAAVWFMGSGVLSLLGFCRKKMAAYNQD